MLFIFVRGYTGYGGWLLQCNHLGRVTVPSKLITTIELSVEISQLLLET